MWYDKKSDTTIDTKEKIFDKFTENFETTFYPFNIKATTYTNLAKLTQEIFQDTDGTLLISKTSLLRSESLMKPPL